MWSTRAPRPAARDGLDYLERVALAPLHARAHGLTVEKIWQEADNPNVVHFLLRCETREGAETFMERPESRDAGERSGVTGGDYAFLGEVDPG